MVNFFRFSFLVIMSYFSISNIANAKNLILEDISFEDINGNGSYDSGSDPMPPFYGLSNLNNSEDYKNIAEYYQIEINGVLIEDVIQPCYSNPDDIYLNEYCYFR